MTHESLHVGPKIVVGLCFFIPLLLTVCKVLLAGVARVAKNGIRHQQASFTKMHATRMFFQKYALSLTHTHRGP